MEAELLTVLGRIPAPEDRDVSSQLEGIEKYIYISHTQKYKHTYTGAHMGCACVTMYGCVCIGPRARSSGSARSSFRRDSLGSPEYRPSWRRQSKKHQTSRQCVFDLLVFLCV